MKRIAPLFLVLSLIACDAFKPEGPQITHFSVTGTDGSQSSRDVSTPIDRLENMGRFSLDYRIKMDFNSHPDVIIAISNSGNFNDENNEVLVYIHCDNEDPYCNDAALECVFDPAFDVVCGEGTPVEYHTNLAQYFERTGLPPNESFLILDTCYNRTFESPDGVFSLAFPSDQCDRTSTRVVFR